MRHEDDQFLEEQLRVITIEVALRAGLLKKCPLHEELFDAQKYDAEAAYKLANYLITNNDPLVEPFNKDRRRLTDIIKNLCYEFSACCPLCEKNSLA